MAKKKSQMPGLDLVGADLAKVEKLLKDEVRSEVKLVLDVGRHILGGGGKRFRPALALLAGKLCGMRPGRELYSYAAAMELAHNSTLLHDDVIDEAEIRRGKQSANRAFGNAPSIIVGDYLLFKSFMLMMAGKNLKVIRHMDELAVEMAEGEAYQLMRKGRVDLDEDDYERIIRAKTALLIQGACQVPAIAAGVPRRRVNALAKFGYHLGLAFQIVDDVLDYSATDAGWGKALGKDFMESKATLPVILAFQNGSAADRKLIRALFKKPDKTRADFARLIKVLNDAGAIDESRQRALDNVALAKKKLSSFPESKVRRALMDLADFVVERTV